MLRKMKLVAELLASVAIAIVLVPSGGHAQQLGDPNAAIGAQISVPQAASAKPYAPVNTTAQGSCTGVASACVDRACFGSDSCQCVSFTGFSVKLPQVGAVSLNAELNLDLNLANGLCDVAYGIGTGSTKSGDTVNFLFNGQFCFGSSVADTFSGPWLASGGTGKLASANGTGLYSETVSTSLSTQPCVFTMDGAFRKTP
jgi:hypothetical protein